MLKSSCSNRNLGCSIIKAILFLWEVKVFASSLEMHVLYLNLLFFLSEPLHSTPNFHFLWKVSKIRGRHKCVVFYVLLYIRIAFRYLKGTVKGAWVVQSGKHLSLGFGSGHDPRVVRSSPRLGMEPA